VAAARARHLRSLPEPAETTADFGPQALRRHKGLRKHESVTLTQIRTGKIGLRAFLAKRRVPGIVTPLCPCSIGPETPEYIIIHCPDLQQERLGLRSIRGHLPRTRRDLAETSTHPSTVGALAKWMLRIGRLREFRLAEQIARAEKAPEEAPEEEVEEAEEEGSRDTDPNLELTTLG
jgi:hypothetical protein